MPAAAATAAAPASVDIAAGKTLFKNQCASCHNKNMKDKLTGPALGGVQERWAAYPKEDLYSWIRNSQAMINSGHPRAVEQMGVDARHLWCRVGTQSQRAATELIEQLERLEIQDMTSAGQQRLDVLEHGRHDQFVAKTTRGIKPHAAQLLYTAGLRRQDVSNVLWQQPSRRHKENGWVLKTPFYRRIETLRTG